MQEATLLCDRVALLYQGKIVETGQPANLIKKEDITQISEFVFATKMDGEEN